MANNPYVNRVQTADGSTIMDITDTTATVNNVANGMVFYSASGERSVGTLQTDQGVSMFSDIPLSIATTDWTSANNEWTYTYSNALIKETSGIQVIYDTSYRTALTGDIDVDKYTGYIVITTNGQPAGTLTATLRILDTVSGTLPISRGGTGAITGKGARQNLNVSIKPIEIDFGTVSSSNLPKTVTDADITSDMVPVSWIYGTPSAIPNGLVCTTSDSSGGSVTLSLPSGGSIDGSTTVKVWLENKRTVADDATGQQGTQYAGDYVQIGAQTLTATQQAQVKTNIGIVYSESTAPSNPVEGMIWLKKKV